MTKPKSLSRLRFASVGGRVLGVLSADWVGSKRALHTRTAGSP
jgi:hypothetical protein